MESLFCFVMQYRYLECNTAYYRERSIFPSKKCKHWPGTDCLLLCSFSSS